ncbi:MAG: DUF2723 domain-containing protein [Chlorobiota bacterium]|nr:MAG: DUF2723 domain-containing protein [Chlorobiota bacterium]
MPRGSFCSPWYDTALVVAITGALYSSTAAPDLYYTDCGELAGVAATLGVAHPTGYPLFTLIGHGWVQLPLPLSPIGKLGALMVVLGAAAAGLMHRLMLRLLGELGWLDARGIRGVALSTALLLATARTIWAQSLSVEVHALQVVLIVHLLYWLIRWEQTRLRSDQLWAAFALGLCFTNHLSSIVLLPGTLLFALMHSRGQWHERLRQLQLPAAITLACSIVYAYLPLRSASEPLFNWGEVHRSLSKFLYHVLGKQYSIWLFSGSARQQLGVFGSLLLPNVAVPFALLGFWALWKHSRAVAWLLLALAGVCVSYVINYSIPDIEPYFATAFIAGAIATGIGIAALWRLRLMRYLALVLPIVYTLWNWRAVDLRHHWLVREYVRLIVEPLPRGSIVLSQQWDYFCSAFWYMQQVEGYRPDVVLIEKELLRRTWYLHQLARWYGEPIARCSTEIAAYTPLLEEFESGEMPKERYSIIQRAFVALLRGFVERNPDRAAFATPEVLETEPDFAAAVTARAYGATLALNAERHTLPPPLVYDARRLLESSSRYHSERLDRGLIALASLAYVRTGDALLARNSAAIESARQCYRIALLLDQKSSAARERLSQLGRN